MEQAVNTFNKGLQTDTHPMVQGSDTLSDALNATFVTMNGNEVILQNDMGNRRVDNAYLPSGYEPVGMKEYGGIIYVAAYNPITNKSLLGSFPSPERKISSNDDPDLGGTLNLSNLTEYYYDDNLNGLKCIYKDTILVPLTKDTSLHAGDKFVVYGTLTNTSELTNYHNTTGNKVVSPKNKKYTLALGILNSQNEFVDITKTLVRWDGSRLIEYDDNISDLYKFNDGYFIASSFSNPNFDETKSDAELIIERQTIATNTYAYKLVGPLYVKATLNHIKEFNYNIYGIATNASKTQGEIWIEAFVTYNCPDGLTRGGGSDDNYSTYAEGLLSNFPVFDLYGNSNNKISELSVITISKEKTKYDPNKDLYTYKIVKHYKISKNKSNTLFEYVIGVLAVNNQSLYLSGLSTKGEIDLALLGSGEVKLKGWRFICDYKNEASTITYSFDAYPKYGESFQNFKFIVTDSKNSSDTREIPANLFNGRTNLNIDWKTYGLSPNKLYRITWKYDIVGDTTTSKVSTSNSDSKQKDRWLLTTELFNNCYSPNSGDYIQDYGDPQGSSSLSNPQTEAYVLSRKQTVGYFLTPSVSDKSDEPITTHTGEILSESTNIELVYTTTKDVRLNLSSTITFDDKLYPDYVTVKEDAPEHVDVTDFNSHTDGLMDYFNSIDYNKEKPTIYEPKFDLELADSEYIIGKLLNYDYYQSTADVSAASSTYVKNGFISFYDYLEKLRDLYTGPDKLFSMIVLDWDAVHGDDGHFLKVDVNSPQEKMSREGSDGDDTATQERLAEGWGDTCWDFTMKEYNSAVLDRFLAIPYKYPFTWGYYSEDRHWITSTPSRNTGYNANTWARVWWRTTSNTWALFPTCKNYSTGYNLNEFLRGILTTDFKFAYYATVPLSEINRYLPDINKYQLSEDYIFPYLLNWKMSINKNAVFNISNPSGFSCTYPKFVPGDLDPVELEYSFNVLSSNEFTDIVKNIANLSTDLDGFDAVTGKILDKNNQKLNSNNFYKDVNGELVYWNTTHMALSEVIDNRRNILYNREDTIGTPNQSYDVAGANPDNESTLLYNNIIIVRGCT